MTEHPITSAKGWGLFRWLFAVAFIIAVAASGLLSGLLNQAGIFYLFFGSVAAALMGFTGREIAAAIGAAFGRPGDGMSLGRSAYFWEAAARNAWILGAFGSALNFTVALSRESGGIADIANRMIQSLVVMLYGLVMAIICLVPAMKLSSRAEKAGEVGEPGAAVEAGLLSRTSGRAFSIDRIIGYVLFAAVIALTVAFLFEGRPQGGPLSFGKLLLHAPAYLIVFGGTIAVALFMGAATGARAWTVGFAVTGLTGLFMGLLQALFGFVHRNIGEIASAAAFIISASSLSLLGLVGVAAPLEDREVMAGRRKGAGPVSRLFWVLLPLLTFLFLILAFIMIVTPMKQVAK